MNKFICLFLAILFICTVIVHGKSERFSIEAMLTNLTNFEDIPTIDDIINIWKSNSYFDDEAYDMPVWLDFYALPGGSIPVSPETERFLVHYYVPTAFNDDYTINNDVEYSIWTYCYDEFGNRFTVPDPQFPNSPIIRQYQIPVCDQFRHTYEHYAGTNEVLEFFDNVRAFFSRLGTTISVIVQMIIAVVDNAQYLLPWNNTVARE